MANESLNVVSVGGGNGHAAVAKGLVASGIPGLRVKMITTTVDDGDTSTGRLSKKGNTPGYYGDVTRILDALHVARFGEREWLSRHSANRFASGIARGQSFGELFASLFGARFASEMKGLRRQQTITSICTLLHLDECDDDAVRVLLREAFEYLLEEDSFSKHSFRNLFLFTLERIAKRRRWKLSKALEAMHVAYRIPENYRVVPVTWEPTVFKGLTKSRELIEGQFKIDFRDRDPNFKPYDEIEKMWLDPPVTISGKAKQAILMADAVIISCGSLKGNVNAPFLVKGMREALRERAEIFEEKTGLPLPILHVVNLMNEPGDTISGRPYTAEDVVNMAHAATGCRPNRIIYDITPLSKMDERHFLPKLKIRLGNLKDFETSSDFERPSLLKRYVAEVVRDKDSNFPLAMVHDPEKLASAFREALLPVPVGAL